MTQLAEIQSHIGSMSELLDVVGAMRSLAGMRVQEAQRTLLGVRRYAEAMAGAISAALLLMPEPAPAPSAHGRRALLLFTAEHGFVGGFNQSLVESDEAAPAPHDTFFVLGSRGAALAYERGRQVTWTRPMATRAASAPETVRSLTAELYRRIARGEISRVEVVFARSRQASRSIIERRLLLPLDLASLAEKRPGQAPFHNLEPQALLEKLMAEYVFALLTEAAIESIASENAARFAAMDSAHEGVTAKLEQLHQSARQARQSEITAELLDLVTGAEALTPPTHARDKREPTAAHPQ
ncbi:MAG TPA: FoF1 ATP synthase subunit gamma [Stellaceae bacterium]|nr:FoF1 ATP synthase subunit gamma [Stellaceae bacterium]